MLAHKQTGKQATTPVIHSKIAATRDVKYSTVRTIVDRLERKGAIERLPQQGRAVIFQPLTTRAEVSLPLAKKFVENVFGGDSRPLLSHLLDSETLNAEDLAYLESVIQKRKSELPGND